jgi:histidyl-tRNA synthetase
MRDFGPETVRKRNYILDTIRNVFELYGFQPLETPAMENLETLMGKYGEEGDKLIFKVLNNGLDNPAKQEQVKQEFEKILSGRSSKGITERALKYDLTIPFARYVAMNHHQLAIPFKRYQVQPVWRADRPQRGRYREFYQCDADVAGSNSLLNEVELAMVYCEVFNRLGVTGYELRVNHRKILSALAGICGGEEKMMDITIAIDKLDKIGIEKVKDELLAKGLNNDQIATIEKYLGIQGTNDEIISGLETLIGDTENGKAGINDLRYLISNLQQQRSNIQPDPTLARGLNYYTGIIFEVRAPESVKMGSIGGGGRYDDLTGLFGLPNVPGVGISFGVDRIYDVMEELNLFPENVHTGTQVLLFNMGEKESQRAFTILTMLRSKGIRSELFHEASKMDKQFKYAEKKRIPYIIIVGEKEMAENTVTIKNLGSGLQETITVPNLQDYPFNQYHQ